MPNSSDANAIKQRELAVAAEIDKLIRSVSNKKAGDATVTYLIDKIRKRRALLAVKPEFTPEVVGIAKQIIAFGGAGFGFVLAFGATIPKDHSILTICLGLLYFNITAVSIFILTWFFCQARTRYPWLYLERLGNSDQYFYYNAVPIDYRYRPFYILRQSAHLRHDLTEYLNNLSRFAKTTVTESKLEELKNELIQYHLLLFYEGYLDQYEQQLTHIALYGFTAGIIGAIAVPVLSSFMGWLP